MVQSDWVLVVQVQKVLEQCKVLVVVKRVVSGIAEVQDWKGNEGAGVAVYCVCVGWYFDGGVSCQGYAVFARFLSLCWFV